MRQPLQTKFYLPPLRQAIVRRPHLTARINAGVQKALTLISSPAGFGKTTLLAEWAAQTGLPLAWISLDGEDNDPARFMAGISCALRNAKALRQETLDFLESGETLPAHVLLETIIGDLAANPRPDGSSLVLALDDYHLIHQQEVHDLLAFLLDHLPAGLRLLISTRADPPLRLARLRAKGEICEMRAEDLRFRLGEAGAFFAQVMGLDLDSAALAILEQRTEGWIAGMQLAALSMQGRKDTAAFIQAFSGGHRYILDYLIEEVLSHQPQEIQQFLLRTAILDRLSAGLCDAVNDIPSGSQALLETLERSNLFVVALDDERRWYRYHHLFADLLRVRLQLLLPEQIPSLHARAAVWLEQNGFVTEAVRHAFDSGDTALAAGLLERHAQERWSFSDLAFLNLLSRLPPETLAQRPKLGVFLAWTHILFGRLPEAQEILDQLARRLPETEEPESQGIHGFCTLLAAYIQTMRGWEEDIRLPDRQVLEFIPEHMLAMRNSADVIYARLLTYRGQFEEAEQILYATIRRDVAANGTTAIPICASILSRLLVIQGRLHAAADLCRDYLAQIAARGKQRFYINGILNFALAEVLIEWNDLDGAEQLARDGLHDNENWRIPHAIAQGHMILAKIHLARAETAAAEQALGSAEEATAGRFIPLDLRDELNALRNQLEAALGKPPASDSTPAGPRENNLIDRARLCMNENRFDEALSVLGELQARAVAGKRTGRLIKIYLLRAIALYASAQSEPAFRALRTCLDLAEAEAYIRAFVDEGEPARALLAEWLREPGSSHREYARRLLDAFPSPARAGRAQPGPAYALIEPLTGRELEVLRCLHDGDSNQGIAAKLFISLSAVKKHTGNIYGKLGVNSRTQALARARELGLLEKD